MCLHKTFLIAILEMKDTYKAYKAPDSESDSKSEAEPSIDDFSSDHTPILIVSQVNESLPETCMKNLEKYKSIEK